MPNGWLLLFISPTISPKSKGAVTMPSKEGMMTEQHLVV